MRRGTPSEGRSIAHSKSDHVPALARRSGRYAHLKVVHDEAEPNEASGSLLGEIARDAARQMLAVALQAVSAYIDAHAECCSAPESACSRAWTRAVWP
jgi:hypothetical protein